MPSLGNVSRGGPEDGRRLGLLGHSAAMALMLFLVQNPARKPAAPAPPSSGPEQPIPFSHKTHLAVGLKCDACHSNPDPGADMALPTVQKCMLCHATIAADQPDIRKLAAVAKTKQPIEWVRVYKIPTFVTWSHRFHLNAGIGCAMCHGDLETMDVTRRAMDVTTMAGCVYCHRVNQASTDCGTCHSDM
jgi:hypothetical protein